LFDNGISDGSSGYQKKLGGGGDSGSGSEPSYKGKTIQRPMKFWDAGLVSGGVQASSHVGGNFSPFLFKQFRKKGRDVRKRYKQTFTG